MFLQGSVTSGLHIWPENDISKEKDFAKASRPSPPSLARISFRVLSSLSFNYPLSLSLSSSVIDGG